MSHTPLHIEHAITGSDITEFMLRFNLSMEDLSELLSIPKPKLNDLLSSQKPVDDVAIALLVRVYCEFPHLVPRFDIYELYNTLSGTDEQKLRHLSVPFGRDSSASYRWINKGRPMSGQPLALGRLIKRLPDGLEDLKRLSIKEAKYRGVNPYKTGSWSKPEIFDQTDIAGRTYRPRKKKNLPSNTEFES